MKGINKAIVIGNLGRDPETRYTQAGSAITNFSVATSESWTDKQSGQKKEQTEWHNIACFGALAEIAGKYLRKGSKVYIEGKMRTSSWEKDGHKQYKTEIVARELQMLDSREAQSAQPAPQPAFVDDALDSDIPFAWLLPILGAPWFLDAVSAVQSAV